MNLEQRVQVLEQEVQLLKAQIQATLLDMQEQLLNAKYPILRSEEPAPAAPAAVPPPVAASASPVRRVVLTEPEPEEAPVDVRPARSPAARISDDVDVVPAAVKVRSNGYHAAPPPEPPGFNAADWEDEEYEQPRASRVAEPPKPRRGVWEEEEFAPPRQPRITEPPKPARPEPVYADDEAARDWIELENWVSQKVEKLGITRTRELINLYTRQERFSRQERELLLQFVNIYDGTSKPANAQEPKAAAERPSIVPQTRAVVEELRNELRQKRNAAKNKTETYPLSEQQELVMRLIAGILNAGDDDESSKRSF